MNTESIIPSVVSNIAAHLGVLTTKPVAQDGQVYEIVGEECEFRAGKPETFPAGEISFHKLTRIHHRTPSQILLVVEIDGNKFFMFGYNAASFSQKTVDSMSSTLNGKTMAA